MFHPVEFCKRCGEKFRRPFGISPGMAHKCLNKAPPSLKVYTEEEKKEFERKRKEEEASRPKKAQPKPGFRRWQLVRQRDRERAIE